MIEAIVVVIFLAWYIFSLVISETMGKKRKIGVEWSFFYCMILSPVLGYFITLLSGKAEQKT